MTVCPSRVCFGKDRCMLTAPDEPRGYDDRDRSRSPRVGNGDSHRNRSASPDGRERVDSRYASSLLFHCSARTDCQFKEDRPPPAPLRRKTKKLPATPDPISLSPASTRVSPKAMWQLCSRSMVRSKNATSCATLTPKSPVASVSSTWSPPTPQRLLKKLCRVRFTKAGP